MTVIRPAVKANPRVPIRAWVANGCLVECDAVDGSDEARRHPPPWLLIAALVLGALVGWGFR